MAGVGTMLLGGHLVSLNIVGRKRGAGRRTGDNGKVSSPGSGSPLEDLPAIRRSVENNFSKYATIRIDGQRYMSPRAFLDYVTETCRTSVGDFDETHYTNVIRNTPRRWRGSASFFRDIDEDGALSFEDFVFLVYALMYTPDFFRPIFKILSDDKSYLNYGQFAVMQAGLARGRSLSPLGGGESPGEHVKELQACRAGSQVPGDQPLPDTTAPLTTLSVHLFGTNRDDVLRFVDLCRFIQYFQAEIAEVEFYALSGGTPTISANEFLWLLSHNSYPRYVII